jgi:hypothetical protein
MRVIIGGSKSVSSLEALEEAVARSGFAITRVITGDSRGADTLAASWARAKGIQVEVVVPDWRSYGGRADGIRNAEIVRRANACIVVWDGFSRGTAALIEECKRRALPLLIYECNPQQATARSTTRVTTIDEKGTERVERLAASERDER